MRKTALAIMCLVVGMLSGTDAMAQAKWQWRTDWGPPRQRVYDAKTVATMKGTVVSVERIPAHEGEGYAVQLQMKTAAETITVYLGPSWYLDQQDTKVEAKDEIEVKGSRIKFRRKPLLIAAEVHKGKTVLMLRDANGVAVWAGLRGRP